MRDLAGGQVIQASAIQGHPVKSGRGKAVKYIGLPVKAVKGC